MTPVRTLLPSYLLGALFLWVLVVGCGSGANLEVARKHMRRGNLDAAAAVLADGEGAEVAQLRREVELRRTQREELRRELDGLRARREAMTGDELLAGLDALLSRAGDKVEREWVELELSAAVDWAAERRSGVHAKADLSMERRADVEDAATGAPPAPRVAADPLLQLVLEDVDNALREKSWRRAIAIAEMALEDAPESAPRALALRDQALDRAGEEARSLLADVRRVRESEGAQAARAKLAEALWRFPDRGLSRDLHALSRSLTAETRAPVRALPAPGEAEREPEPVAVAKASDAPELPSAPADTEPAAEPAPKEGTDASEPALDAELVEEIELLAKGLVHADGLALEATFETLAGLADEHEAARAALETALAERLERLERQLRSGATLGQLERVAGQRQELDATRKDALGLIFDTKKYFYPYRPPAVDSKKASTYYAVQREVDELVGHVREVWDRPRDVQLPRRFREALVDRAWWSEHAPPEALEASELPEWLDGIEPGAESVSLHDFAWDSGEREELARSRRVRVFNRARWERLVSELDPEERPASSEQDQVRVTNDYRAMFGRRALAWNPALQEAARGHSEYMANTGDFGHFEEDAARRTPRNRMVLAGYKWGVSENCHWGAGDPKSAHESWCGSSGHHRNLLRTGHSEMASSLASSYWTQNFGQGTEFQSDMDRWQD
ncbi:MAG: hypothetical protein GY711_14955 [bacterium]|nr:hypothetical protein [bacterium]